MPGVFDGRSRGLYRGSVRLIRDGASIGECEGGEGEEKGRGEARHVQANCPLGSAKMCLCIPPPPTVVAGGI